MKRPHSPHEPTTIKIMNRPQTHHEPTTHNSRTHHTKLSKQPHTPQEPTTLYIMNLPHTTNEPENLHPMITYTVNQAALQATLPVEFFKNKTKIAVATDTSA